MYVLKLFSGGLTDYSKVYKSWMYSLMDFLICKYLCKLPRSSHTMVPAPEEAPWGPLLATRPPSVVTTHTSALLRGAAACLGLPHGVYRTDSSVSGCLPSALSDHPGCL